MRICSQINKIIKNKTKQKKNKPNDYFWSHYRLAKVLVAFSLKTEGLEWYDRVVS